MKKLLLIAAIAFVSCRKETIKCWECEVYRDGNKIATEQHCKYLPLNFYNQTGNFIEFKCK